MSWRSKYFQHGPDREPLKVRIPDFPDIESDNTGRVVSRCREAGYSHPNAIKFPSRKKIAREVQSALIRAAAVHAQVLLDNDDDIDTNPGETRGHRAVRKPKYTRKVAAPVGYSGVRWLVDTGCPMDLIGLGDLKGPDKHALHTANGATRIAGHRCYRMLIPFRQLPQSINQHLMGNPITVNYRLSVIGQLIDPNGTIGTNLALRGIRCSVLQVSCKLFSLANMGSLLGTSAAQSSRVGETN